MLKLAVHSSPSSLLHFLISSTYSMGESRTQQEAFSGRLVATSAAFSGAFRVNFVQWCLALCTWVELFCPQF